MRFRRRSKERRPIVLPVVLVPIEHQLGTYVIPVDSPEYKTWEKAARSGARIEMVCDPRYGEHR